MTTSQTTVCVEEGVTSEPSGDRTVILNAAGTTMTTLNPVGSFLWQLLGEPIEVATLADRLVEAFDGLETEVASADVDDFIDELKQLGLVELS